MKPMRQTAVAVLSGKWDPRRETDSTRSVSDADSGIMAGSDWVYQDILLKTVKG